MAELFDRTNVSDTGYVANDWTTMYHVNTAATGAAIFDFSAVNVTSIEDSYNGNAEDININIKIVDATNHLIHYIIPNMTLGGGVSWSSSQKIILMPGDRVLVKASKQGVCFYASIVANLAVNS